MFKVSLSNDSVHRRIIEMAASVKEQVIRVIKESVLSTLSLDESTDIQFD